MKGASHEIWDVSTLLDYLQNMSTDSDIKKANALFV